MICRQCFEETDVIEGRTWCCGAVVGHAVYRDPRCVCGFRLVGGETRCRSCGGTTTEGRAA